MELLKGAKQMNVNQTTCAALAEATGIDQSNISKIETGNANPALSTLIRLAEGMDMVLHLEFIPKQLR